MMKLEIKRTLSFALLIVMLSSCGSDCAKPSNPFPEIQYVLEAGTVDGVFIHSIEWLNIANHSASDTLRIATRAVFFDQPGGNRIGSGSIIINGQSMNRSNDGIFSLEAAPGNLGALSGPLTWQISGVDGHDDFSRQFPFKSSSFFSLDQAFSDIRTNSEFFITINRSINGDDAYVFLCGSAGCITTEVSTTAPGDHYDLSEFDVAGLGNGLIQGTSRLIETINVGSKTYAVIFQSSTAYHTEIINGNEPKCED